QARLTNSRMLIVGMGGLGVPASVYLALAGTGKLLINDFDCVDESNLARQPLYTRDDVGESKVAVAAERLAQLNPECSVTTIDRRIDTVELRTVISDCDVVLDASDNFGTRFEVNAACVDCATPLVSGAAIRGEAQLAVFRPDLESGPCYRCLYDESSEEMENCRGQGVIPALVGMIGCAMALEAMRVVVGFGEAWHSKLLIHDAMNSTWRNIRLRRDRSCPVCSNTGSG
ncbi:MAG: HesA/MoeB/ThiF family protein, partial [Gammaproteobacteria bacterium]|nr:HesA/MoeB/ThiF family protein [Gammaproteobacteria bacterium]